MLIAYRSKLQQQSTLKHIFPNPRSLIYCSKLRRNFKFKDGDIFIFCYADYWPSNTTFKNTMLSQMLLPICLKTLPQLRRQVCKKWEKSKKWTVTFAQPSLFLSLEQRNNLKGVEALKRNAKSLKRSNFKAQRSEALKTAWKCIVGCMVLITFDDGVTHLRSFPNQAGLVAYLATASLNFY